MATPKAQAITTESTRESNGFSLSPSALRGFSCPFELFSEELHNLLLREHAASVARLTLDRHESHVRSASQGLVDALQIWLDGGFSLARPSDPAFGQTQGALGAAVPAEVVDGSCAIALYLASEGLPSKWDVQLSRTRTFRWGAFVLPPAERIAIESDGRAGVIETRNNGTSHRIQIQNGASGWTSNLTPMPRISVAEGALTVLPREALDFQLPDHVMSEALGHIEPEMLEPFRQAVGILEQYVPEYIPWVRRALSHIFLLNPLQGKVESGSMENYLGFSHFSAYSNAAALAELLIHEAAHQYFNVLCLLGPFDDGTDQTLYHSSAVGRPRPLDRIGVAYHAFANVMIYYRECVAKGIQDDGWCARHIESWTEGLRVLEQPLRGNPALTDIGKALCEPLIERVPL
jgi:HEXXH motif-containing protein